ncbi:MAG: ATP-binding protein [Chloroflexi bacterium]|nr:ATP-binding protein [Chloroflexota bacterium]MBU1747050.1 ATP-binding protein [Chloroflexota bacterium]
MAANTFPLGELSTEHLIGRDQERAVLRAVIDMPEHLAIVYVLGKGGQGKTRLLQAIPTEIMADHTSAQSVTWVGIFDLYHADIHTNSGIERAIIRQLESLGHKRAFAEYHKARAQYDRFRQAGGFGEALETRRRELGALFVEGFNKLTEATRLILCFDTVEMVQYESDVVQQVCGLEYGGVEVREWLEKTIPQLRNVVVVIAGRVAEKPHLWRDLQGAFGKALGQAPLRLSPDTSADQIAQARHIEIRLGGLSESETLTYFADLAERNERIRGAMLEAASCVEIYALTQGQPLRIAFVSTLIAGQSALPGNLLADMAGQQTHVDRLLIEEIQRLNSDVEIVLPYLALARKGLNGKMLRRMLAGAPVNLNWTLHKCTRVLNYIKGLPFAKTRPNSDLVFLHDEMYRLMNEYVLAERPQDLAVVCQVMETYYDEAIEEAQKAETTAKTEASRTNQRRDWQQCATERLYYQLLADPRRGFAVYRTLSDNAILGHEVGYDMSLRDETLRFFETQSDRAQQQLARDSAVRWVKRFLEQANYLRALAVANAVLAYGKPPFQHTGRDLFGAALQLYRGEALAYLGQNQEAEESLTTALAALLDSEPHDEYETQDRLHMIGRARHDLGYVYVWQNRIDEAVIEYSTAMSPLRQSGYESRRADTERDLAYAYALQGRWTDAVNLCEESLHRFRRTGQRYGEALALNVYGIVMAENDHPHRARERSEDALRIFRELDDDRGIGLSCMALGRAYRKLGNDNAYLFKGEADRFFAQARDYVSEALTLFTSQVSEPPRRREALAELGRIYRDWADLYRRRAAARDMSLSDEDSAQVADLDAQAREYLEQFIAVADAAMPAEQADVYEDLAELYLNQEQWVEALAFTDRVEQSTLPICRIWPGQGLHECPIPKYWLLLGKANLVRARVAMTRSWPEAIEYLTLAFAYFEAYSSTAVQLQVTRDRIYRELMRLTPDQVRELQAYCEAAEAKYQIEETMLRRMMPEAIEAIALIRGEVSEHGGTTDTRH